MMKRSIRVLVAILLAWCIGSTPAFALDIQVSSQTVGQGYQMITLGGDVLKRSRLNQFLGLNLWDISGDKKNTWSFVSQFRFDSDFGITGVEIDTIDQLKNNNLSIMYGYFQAHRLADMFDVRLGRQLIIDDMDFTLMDGLRFTAHLPFHLAVEVLGGLEVKNAFLGVISSTQLESDGDGASEPDDAMSVVVGGSLLLENMTDHHAKIGYRQISELGDDGGLDGARIFANYHYRVTPWLHLSTAGAWDLIIDDFSDIRAEVRMPGLADVLDVELAYWKLIPTFEGSSIFNVFSTQPMNDVDLRFRYHFSQSASAYLGGYTRLFSNLVDSDYDDQDKNDEIHDDLLVDIGFRTGGRFRFSDRARIEVDCSYQTGYGDMAVIDLGGGYQFLDHRLDLTARFTTVIFEDALLSQLKGASIGGQLGLAYTLPSLAKFHLISEINSNKFETVQFRMFGLIDLEVWL